MSKLMARDSIVSSSAREYTAIGRRGNSANQAGARMAQSYFGPNIAITTTVRNARDAAILAQIRRMAVLERVAVIRPGRMSALTYTGRSQARIHPNFIGCHQPQTAGQSARYFGISIKSYHFSIHSAALRAFSSSKMRPMRSPVFHCRFAGTQWS